MNKLKKYWWLLVLIVIMAVVGGAFVWLNDSLPPMPEALAALQSDTAVTVTSDPWYVFQPAGGQPDTGFIFYPGGKVDPRAYAPPARALAAEGYLAVITPMPFNLAVFSPNEADDVMQAYPGIAHWVIGGHSLGGAMAAQYAADHPDAVDGLVLWAAYPPQGVDLTGASIAATSIYGTNDGLVSQEDIDDSRSRLPPTTEFVPIAGGNHAQFGSYGAQKGDRSAEISEADQQAQIAAATIETLAAMTGSP